MESFGPKYRASLKARIFEVGFKTIREFACAAGTDSSRVSRVVHGREFPSENLTRAMAEALRLSHDDLKGLL